MLVLLVIIGPSRLPEVTNTLTKWVKNARVQLTKLRASLDGEVGDDLRNLDLSAFNVRQYDPRNVIRKAVQEELQEWKDLVNPLVPLDKAGERDSDGKSASSETNTTSSSAATNADTAVSSQQTEPHLNPAQDPQTPPKAGTTLGPGSVVQPALEPVELKTVPRARYRQSARDEAIAAWYASQRKRRTFGSRPPQLSHRARYLKRKK